MGGGLSAPCSEAGGPSLPGSTMIPARRLSPGTYWKANTCSCEEAWATLLLAGWGSGSPPHPWKLPREAWEDLCCVLLLRFVQSNVLNGAASFLNDSIRVTDSMDRKLIKLWEIVGQEEPGMLWSTGLQRVGHGLATEQQQSVSLFLFSLLLLPTLCKPVGSDTPQPGIEPASPAVEALQAWSLHPGPRRGVL